MLAFPEKGVKRTYSSGVLIDTAVTQHVERLYQFTQSQGNPVSRIGKGEDVGGSFFTKRVSTTVGDARVSFTGGNVAGISYSYEGPIGAQSLDLSCAASDALTPSTKSQMDVYGTQAIARCIPTNPLSGMGEFLGELRDLPKIPDVLAWKDLLLDFRKATKRVNFDKLSRSAADETLNQLFGWSPFIKDLLDFAHVVQKSSLRMEQYARGSNHLIRRRYRFPVVNDTVISSASSSPGNPALPSPMIIANGTLIKTTRTETQRYFSGAFTYYLPPVLPEDNGFVQAINKWRQAEAYANRLFGLRLNPELLYKLTPWTWAAGWLTDAGSVVHNWQSFSSDGLVLHHGYIMESLFSDESWSLTNLKTTGGTVNSTQTRRKETKSRARATPYGFGVNPSSFTGKQWAVIAALGISRQPLSLNF